VASDAQHCAGDRQRQRPALLQRQRRRHSLGVGIKGGRMRSPCAGSTVGLCNDEAVPLKV
jgi:hypothetical protein